MADLDLAGIITRVCTDLRSKFAPLTHAHGDITSSGDITATAPTIASGDQLVINDHSANKITNGPTFDGSTTTTALTPKGTWETFTDEKLKVEEATDVSLYPVLTGNTTTSTTKWYDTTIYYHHDTTNNIARLNIGDQSIQGGIYLHSGSSGSTYPCELVPSNNTDLRTITLPDASGTVVLASGGVVDGRLWADATATGSTFLIQSIHTNGKELSLTVKDNGWITLHSLTVADDWSTVSTVTDIPLVTMTPTISISSTTGTLNSTSIKRFGNVVQLTINVKNSSAIAAGGLLYKGTISTTALRPKIVATGGGRNASRHGIGTISTAGVIEIYVSTAWSANAAADFSFTYLI